MTRKFLQIVLIMLFFAATPFVADASVYSVKGSGGITCTNIYSMPVCSLTNAPGGAVTGTTGVFSAAVSTVGNDYFGGITSYGLTFVPTADGNIYVVRGLNAAGSANIWGIDGNGLARFVNLNLPQGATIGNNSATNNILNFGTSGNQTYLELFRTGTNKTEIATSGSTASGVAGSLLSIGDYGVSNALFGLDLAGNLGIGGAYYLSASGIRMGVNTLFNGDGSNTIIRPQSAGAVYIQNTAANMNIAHFPNAGGMYLDTGSISVTSGNISVPAGGITAGSGYYNQSGDIGVARTGSPTTGVIYLGNTGSHYLYYDGSNYSMPNGSLYISNGGGVFGGGITATSVGATGVVSGDLLAGNGGVFGGRTNSVTSQGMWLQWNRIAGTGESDFINQKGGGSGGFQWFESDTANNLTNKMTLDAVGNLTVAGNFYANSRRSLKSDIHPMNSEFRALDLISKTNWVGFRYKKDPKNQSRRYGFIADDTDAVMAGPKHDHFDVNTVAAVDAQAIKELKSEVDALKIQLNSSRTNNVPKMNILERMHYVFFGS